jgi:hypothetical protein
MPDLSDILILVGFAAVATGLGFVNPFLIIVLAGGILTALGLYRR